MGAHTLIAPVEKLCRIFTLLSVWPYPKYNLNFFGDGVTGSRWQIYRHLHTKNEICWAFPPWDPTWYHLLWLSPECIASYYYRPKRGGVLEMLCDIPLRACRLAHFYFFFIHISSPPPLSSRNYCMGPQCCNATHNIGVYLFKVLEALLGNIVRIEIYYKNVFNHPMDSLMGHLGGSPSDQATNSWFWLQSWSHGSWVWAPHWALCWQHGACLTFSVSLSLYPSLARAHAHSLSLS